MKICSICKLEKTLLEFNKSCRTKSGLYAWCKPCAKIKHYEWVKQNILKHPWYNSYTNAEQRCNNPKSKDFKYYGARGIKFLLSKEDCIKLWERDKGWLLIEHSIDRIDNNGNYTFDNCQFIEMGLNNCKRNIRACSKSVIQFDKQWHFIKEWNSASEAGRKLKIDISSITKCCRGKVQSAGGFFWKYK